MTGWPAGDEYERSRSGSSGTPDAAEPLLLTVQEVRSDHVCAAIEILERQIARLANGASPEDIGPDVVLIGRLLERKT